MSLFTILETILIAPLKLIFEVIFSVANRMIGHPGLAIIMLSLVMNILVLPLYRRADAMQEEARDTDARLRDGIAHIKKTFSGDERMMILQTYYRQNHYKPTSALNGSVSLLLEIPFFMAAYQFLSHLEILNGVSLGPIADLGAPDGLIVIGGIAINLLPILMTLVNVISSALYLKGFPLKTKIQLYGMALFFLVFLYTSPSCLVFYWTLNNVFSLVKTIFYKLKNPRKILQVLTSLLGISFLIFGAFFYKAEHIEFKYVIFGIAGALLIPAILPLFKRFFPKRNVQVSVNRKRFLLGGLFLSVLLGLLIPTTLISASPQEFIDPSFFHDPIWYVVSTACLAAGTFLVWMGVFYWIASDKGKVIFEKLMWILSGIMLVNYMFFGNDLGMLSATLQYQNGLLFTNSEQWINLVVLVIVAVVLYVIVSKWSKIVIPVLLTATVALSAMSVMNINTINTSVDEISKSLNSQVDEDLPNFTLSKEGQNVVVIMLDRAVGAYVPYMFNERPELKDQFDGFTYHSNTISYGFYTNFGVPALLGGYEYTPVEMNRRDDELLADKHNEALKVMPVLFSENGFDVTVCDPTYAGYQWIPDLSIYNEYPEIETYITKGKFSNADQKETAVENNYRNFFCFAVMKSMPVFLQTAIYDNGMYHQTVAYSDKLVYGTQTTASMSKATGVTAEFMEPYNVLLNLSYMTKVSESSDNTFLYLANDVTHEPMILSMPDYTPAQTVDNSIYDLTHMNRFTINGQSIDMDSAYQMRHYHANMAAMIQLGKWFDYLRENDVYDNTRIILVSDHGQILSHLDELVLSGESEDVKLEAYFPLLMVKDFNAKGFETSTEFMTNADVPTLAVDGLIENPVNPFTGKVISNDEKYAHEQFVTVSWDYSVYENNGYTFLPSMWASVKDNLWDINNWTIYEDVTVLKEHKAP